MASIHGTTGAGRGVTGRQSTRRWGVKRWPRDATGRHRAPGGGATLKLLTIAPRDLEGSGWATERDRFGRALIERVARDMDFEPDDALAVLAECALDLEERNPHNYLGSCHGGELSLEQSGTNRPLPGWSQYRMPVAGLYQTGPRRIREDRSRDDRGAT